MLQVRTFRTLLLEAAERFGRAPFLINDPSLGSVSYEDLARFSLGLERKLDELEIPLGASVATIFHNCGLAALLFLSVIASRRVLVPINPISTRHELQYMLRRCECALVLADPGHTLSCDIESRRLLEVPDHHSFFRSCLLESTHARECIHEVKEFPAEVVFTSGSTGSPKGVVLSQRSLIANAGALVTAYGLHNADRFLTVCPLFHNSGQVFTTLACALVGGSTAAVKSSTGMQHFWAYVTQYRADWSFGMVSFLSLLLSRPDGPDTDTSMRGLLTGGSAIDAALIQRFESRFRIPVRTVYGLTETSSISTCEYLDPMPRSWGSSGRPLPICEVRIASTPCTHADHAANPVATRGEILISGDNVFEYYLGDPALTQSRKVDGWVHTGDVGYFDEHGNLFVVDRLDSMLIVGGENVYPAEIERLCASLPGAAQIVLAGVNHAIWGNELVLVYRTEHDEMPSISRWRQILAEHVAAVKHPKRYVSIRALGFDEFPRKENGKLDRRAIAMALQNLPSDS